MSAIPASTVNLKTMADGTLRISFDIEPAHAKDAFGLFAAPGTPVGIAALKVGYAAAPAPEKPKGGPLARLAGQWCKDPAFQDWISGIFRPPSPMEPEPLAARAITVICQLQSSRAELDSDPRGAELFQRLIRAPYMKHIESQTSAR